MITLFSKTQIVELAKEFAEANYDNGMDFFIECYEDSEWMDYIVSKQLMQVLSCMVTAATKRKPHSQENSPQYQ